MLKGLDARKDQSYVLFMLTQSELAHVLLPVGWYEKDHIRHMAELAGLQVATKPDSQDICFIPSGDYRQFMLEQVETRPGDIVDTNGNVLWAHSGIEFFTVGQRRGLGVNRGEPLYVIRLEPETRRVVVGPEDALYRDSMWVSKVNYPLGILPDEPAEITVKIRYKAEEAPAALHPHGDGALVRFRQPQRAVTPGQAAVFYRGDVLVGGGVIEAEVPTKAVAG